MCRGLVYISDHVCTRCVQTSAHRHRVISTLVSKCHVCLKACESVARDQVNAI